MLSRRTIIAIIGLALALSLPLSAQTRRKSSPPPKPQPTPTPAANQTQAASSYLPGEVRVLVRNEQNPVIRIGMAPSGITIVEFPAGDQFFAVHPPQNGDWIEVDKSPSLKTDHHLVLRAGKDLPASNPNTVGGPAASLSVQMRSGLIVTLWVYPVKQVMQQTHRCVVFYDRAEVVAARRKAGLAVNLGEGEEKDAAATTASLATATKPATPAPTPAPTSTPAPASPAIAPRPTSADPQPIVAEVSTPEKKSVSGNLTKDGPKIAARNLLNQALGEPKRFKKWTEALHGLSVATLARDLDEQNRVALVAVKNVQGEPIRIMPGHPELFVETLDDKGRTLQITPLKKLLAESTTTSSVIPAGATVYYAIVYTPPILGTKQHLRVAVGQTNAADDPAAAGLTANK